MTDKQIIFLKYADFKPSDDEMKEVTQMKPII